MTENNTEFIALTIIEKDEISQRIKVFAALSDPTRLRIVDLLASAEELSGTDIANQLGISLALFCHHSKTLVEANLIRTRKDGQTRYHSLSWELLNACFRSFRRNKRNCVEQQVG